MGRSLKLIFFFKITLVIVKNMYHCWPAETTNQTPDELPFLPDYNDHSKTIANVSKELE